MKKEVALFSNLYSQVKCLYIRDSFFANQGSYLWEYWLYFEKNKRWVAEKLALNGSAELWNAGSYFRFRAIKWIGVPSKTKALRIWFSKKRM